jgi:dienelactone hydrolase
MKAFLALLAFLQTTGVHVEPVSVPGPHDVALDAALVLPSDAPKSPAIVALHGCGGPFPERDGQWAVLLAKAGHTVLLPDSFGSRGLGSQCGTTDRSVTPSGLRRLDAIDAAKWLASRPDTPAGGIVLLGWSNGGGTVLYTARTAADLPSGLFRRFIAFYPGCKSIAADSGWHPSAHVTIFQGEADDWTPAAPCHELASEHPKDVTLIAYPGAYHDFDAPNRPVVVRGNSATAVGGQAHVGTNEPAREDALSRVPALLEQP